MQTKLYKGDFVKEVKRIMIAARNGGKDSIEIVLRDIHINLVGYPASNHRMPVCCDAMYELKKDTDEIIYAPKKGKGATLKIRYHL